MPLKSSRSTTCSAAGRACSPPMAAASISSFWTRRISSAGLAIRTWRMMAATGRTMRSALARWDGSPLVSRPATPRASRRIFSTATTGRPGSRWAISPMAAGAVRRPCSPRTISPTRASSRPTCWGGCTFHRTPTRSTASSITGRSASSRPACSWPIALRRCRRLMPRRSSPLPAAAASKGCCALAPACCPASATGSTSTFGIRRPTRGLPRASAPRRCRRDCPTRRSCSGGSDWRNTPAGCCGVGAGCLAQGIDLLADVVPALVGVAARVLGTRARPGIG